MSISYGRFTYIFNLANRAIYNLTEGHIVLPFNNLTEGGQAKRVLSTLAFFIKEARAWTFIVGES
jgi:hypothetical protein